MSDVNLIANFSILQALAWWKMLHMDTSQEDNFAYQDKLSSRLHLFELLSKALLHCSVLAQICIYAFIRLPSHLLVIVSLSGPYLTYALKE